MNRVKNIYRVLRSILFTLLLFGGGLYLLLYIVLCIPAVQNKVSDVACEYLSDFLGGKVEVGTLQIYPFNEIAIKDMRIISPQNEEIAEFQELSTRVSIMSLLKDKSLKFSYVDIVGMDMRIKQKTADSPLNIQYIIDALSPKEKNKPPTKLDLTFHSIILRKCSISFDKEWIARKADKSVIDFNHIKIDNLRLDAVMPKVTNEEIRLHLRRMAFHTPQNFDVDRLSFNAIYSPSFLSVKNLVIELPSTSITPSDIEIKYNNPSDILNSIKSNGLNFLLANNKITPSDFSAFLPALKKLQSPFYLSLDCYANQKNINLRNLTINTNDDKLQLQAKGVIREINDFRKTKVAINTFLFKADGFKIASILRSFSGLSSSILDIFNNAGEIAFSIDGNIDAEKRSGKYALLFSSSNCGRINSQGEIQELLINHANLKKSTAEGKIKVVAKGFEAGKLIGIPDFGMMDFNGLLNLDYHDGLDNLYCNLEVNHAEYRNNTIDNVNLNIKKSGSDLSLLIDVNDSQLAMNATAAAMLNGNDSKWDCEVDINKADLRSFSILPSLGIDDLSAQLTLHAIGDNIDNLTGIIDLSNLNMRLSDGKEIKNFDLTCESERHDDMKVINLDSNYATASITGKYTLSNVVNNIKSLISSVIPDIINNTSAWQPCDENISLNAKVKNITDLDELLSLPVEPLTDLIMQGDINFASGVCEIQVDAPYLKQGKNKLIKNSAIGLYLNADRNYGKVDVKSTVPSKNGEVMLKALVDVLSGSATGNISWNNYDTDSFAGEVKLGCSSISPKIIMEEDGAKINILPSVFKINDAEWNIRNATIDISKDLISVDGIRIWHDNQYVEIFGDVSASEKDELKVRLSDINLDYVFDTLNISNVTFGGRASGEVTGKRLLSKSPVAATDHLYVKDLSYNGCCFGDGNLYGAWDNDEQEVVIKADIYNKGKKVGVVDGGVYVVKDSLSFDFDANKLNIAFLQPFLATFTSDVQGLATGHCKLFGPTKDVDLIGDLKVDTISMLIDYTNVYYSGSDSIKLRPGHIIIPEMKLYDQYGHHAYFGGEVKHRYFRDAKFDFFMHDAKELLAYNTNMSMNQNWYGKVYCSGSGSIRGEDTYCSIDLDVKTEAGSTFTFILNDENIVEDYNFLTFSDKRAESLINSRLIQKTDNIFERFNQQVSDVKTDMSVFVLNLQLNVTPSTQVTLVMDKDAGDKITARGNGALQFLYSSFNDEFRMNGKYVLDEGKYNFSLQDIILKDFTIQEGSNITFNGDPMNSELDIKANYRVNTNLTDLDASFSTDRDLNRTNVPVDAVLMVTGRIDSPEINYDIKLPTLTEEVERKVKSIISSDDMMTRQVLYLLALNRFYTPEYMVTSNNGGELASVASSTISSQLSNMMGRLTDKVALSPSFRSDKGDFSDIEVDLGLSSRLFNNRLLINGNFGYRDRSTSQTTFIGDFDIEYLLNKSGGLRLKAYNHFNDQNYYLKSALTTQGIGLMYRHDFNTLFKNRKKKRQNSKNEKVAESLEK